MAENAEDDDNMIVLLVEDEKCKDPFPIQIKVESLNDSDQEMSGNEIFNSSAHIEEKGNLEEEYITEYLDEDENGEDFDEFNIEFSERPVELDSDDPDNDQDYCSRNDKDARKNKPNKRTKQGKWPKNKAPQKKPLQIKQQAKSPQNKAADNKTPQKYVSYVKQLRTQYPKMAEDEQFLVECLAGVMRKITPPKPPDDYCKVVVEDGKDKYECSFCGAHRDSVPLAARHYQFKHGDMYLTCFACGTNYKNTTSLYKHEKRCRAPDAALVLRARGHYLGRKGRGRPFTTCNKFITSNMLTLKNAKNRLYCTKCPASFVTRDNLEAHENSHEGVRPYRCSLCTVAYTSYPALKRHLAAVHGDERYVCDYCGKKFRLKPALVSHLNVHRTLRKHPCDYCDRRFAQKSALQHHMNKVHLNLPAAHGCPVCPKRYARITHVKEHMDRKHGLMLITARTYLQALPTMTEQEITHAKQLFNFGANAIIEAKDVDVEYILPEMENPTTEDKKEGDIDQNPETEETKSLQEILTDETLETKFEQGIVLQLRSQEEKSESKISALVKKVKISLGTEFSNDRSKGEIDEYIENEDKIKHKRKTHAPEKKTVDDEGMYTVVSDIKKSLAYRRKDTQADTSRIGE